MKFIIFRLAVILVFIPLLFSCTPKEVEYFNLNIVFWEPIDGLKENESFPNQFAALMNYIEDTVTRKRIFVPLVKIERLDFNPTKKLDYEIPLSGLNNFRKSMNLLSYEHIKVDYEKNIKNKRLLVPGILVEKKGNIEFDISRQEDKETILINLNAFSDSLSTIVGNSIKERLNSGKAKGKITLLFYNQKAELVEDSNFADTETNEELPGEELEKNPGTSYPITKNSKTINFPNGDVYVGECKDNLPHGGGTLTFSKTRIIDEDDIKKHKAEAGDRLVGTWRNGKIEIGKLFNSKGDYKFTIIIGGG